MSHRSVQQIDSDLHATAWITHPYNNLGSIIPEHFWDDPEGRRFNRALEIDTAQAEKYLIAQLLCHILRIHIGHRSSIMGAKPGCFHGIGFVVRHAEVPLNLTVRQGASGIILSMGYADGTTSEPPGMAVGMDEGV